MAAGSTATAGGAASASGCSGSTASASGAASASARSDSGDGGATAAGWRGVGARRGKSAQRQRRASAAMAARRLRAGAALARGEAAARRRDGCGPARRQRAAWHWRAAMAGRRRDGRHGEVAGAACTGAVADWRTDALVNTGLAKLGYEYVNIDDCWAESDRDYQGNFVANRQTFPSGIKALADYVHAKGLKLGIYSDAGTRTCSQKMPGSLDHEEQDVKTFSSWGIDYLKYDNCNDAGRSVMERYTKMSNAMKTYGKNIFFSLCEWGRENPATWAGSMGNSWRTTDDIADNWGSMTSRADQNDRWASYAGPGGWNDPDMLEVGNGGMSEAEYGSHFSIWALAKFHCCKPVLPYAGSSSDRVQCTLDEPADEGHTQQLGNSLGIQGKKVQSNNGLEVWAGPLSNNRKAVVLWNRQGYQATITAQWSSVGLASSTAVTARDLWAHSSFSAQGQLSASVAPHDCKMYVVTPK
ncbi:hypothetical protein U9M48_000256 [Paspalum notatum var. saurae]|uniref:Alpha-galactosidase n=1 Tax=Paspalum notatum var. saurae TaxID=547442 RepID=A0AAQ3SEG7_PASNO